VSEAFVVGVDIGTQSTKALLCNSAGRIIAQYSRGYRPDTPRPLWAEQWPAVWLDAVIECIAGCVQTISVRLQRIFAALQHKESK